MLELGIGADVVRGTGWILWAILLLLLYMAIRKPRKVTGKLFCVALVLAIFFGSSIFNWYESYKLNRKYQKGKALFDERCKTAGAKVYKTVDGVEGIFLLNVRADDKVENEANPNWPDAGLPNERSGEDYIASFLMWEQGEEKSTRRGGLNYVPSDLPGYKYVDVQAVDGMIFRYKLENNSSSKLSKSLLKGEPSRYAVTFNNISSETDRQSWVAGTIVSIVDTQTSDVIAESTWYSFEAGQGSKAGARQPWRFARSCSGSQSSQERYPTRFFVDQILKPMMR